MSSRWSAERRWAFDLLCPQAIYLAATANPVAATILKPNGEAKQRFGHNRGCWPVRIGMTRSWRDNVSPLINKDPFVKIGVVGRLWLPRDSDVVKLTGMAQHMLREAAEIAGYGELLNGYIDAGPQFRPSLVLHKIRVMARSMGMITWTDEAMEAVMKRLLHVAKLKGIQIVDGRGRKIMSSNQPFWRLCDRITDIERRTQFGMAIEPPEEVEMERA